MFYKNVLIFRLYFPVTILRWLLLKMVTAKCKMVVWRWLLESATKISVYFYKISIGVINSTLQHHVTDSRYIVCDKTVCLNQHIPPWMFFQFLNCTNGSKSCKASHIIWVKISDLHILNLGKQQLQDVSFWFPWNEQISTGLISDQTSPLMPKEKFHLSHQSRIGSHPVQQQPHLQK